MPQLNSVEIELSPREEVFLKTVSSQQKAEHRLVTRATVILLAPQQKSNAFMARYLHLKHDTVRKWL